MIRPGLAGAGLALAVTGAALAADGVSVGSPAPDFALKSGSGENLRLSEYRGRVVMVNFWASWCGPCRQEMPVLDDLYQRYQPDGFQLLSVNIDSDVEKARDMASETRVSFPVLYDTRRKVAELYQPDAMPLTLLVDREGVVRYLHEGFKPGAEQAYLDHIRTLLKE